MFCKIYNKQKHTPKTASAYPKNHIFRPKKIGLKRIKGVHKAYIQRIYGIHKKGLKQSKN